MPVSMSDSQDFASFVTLEHVKTHLRFKIRELLLRHKLDFGKHPFRVHALLLALYLLHFLHPFVNFVGHPMTYLDSCRSLSIWFRQNKRLKVVKPADNLLDDKIDWTVLTNNKPPEVLFNICPRKSEN
jgi:hypothetical protein